MPEDRAWLTQAIQHASEVYPEESCGLVVDNKYLPGKNVHAEPTERFEISAQNYARAANKGIIQYIVHSHPDGMYRPSYHDQLKQIETGTPWCILPRGKKPLFFGPGMDPATTLKELEERQFIYGINDCYTLIQKAYEIERIAVLESFPSEWGWWKEGENHYMNNLTKMGFRVLDDHEPLERMDCLLGAVDSPVINHVALFLGNSTILHHMVNRLSKKQFISHWGQVLKVRVRYDK